MADNINKQDLQDNTGELNRFNDSLRESIDLSRSLSKNVKSVTDALKLSKGANSELYADLSKYNDALKQAQSLSKRLLTGRVKEQEVSDALKNIEKTYGEYMTRNNKSFGERGRFTIRQKSLQEELNKLADKEVKRQEDIANADARIDSLRRDLVDKETARNATMSRTQRDIADRAIKAIKLQIKEESELIRVIEGGAKNNERIITRKTQELEKVNEIIEAHEGIQRQYEEEIKANKILLEEIQKQKSLTEKVKNEWKGIAKNAADSILKFTSIKFVFDQLKTIAFTISDQIKTLQRGLVLSEDAAKAVRQEFQDIADKSGDTFLTTKKLIEASSELGKQLGFSTKFSEDMNTEFVNLTKRLNISNEAAGGLAKLTKASGREFKDVKNTIYQTTQALSAQNGIQLDQREVMEEVGQITGQTLAMLKGSPKALTEAVAQAKLLGTTLESTKKSSAALLDFESSIENELQAELITGRQFNLERARAAALTGDLTTEMKELASQGIDFNSYSQMNVIAQQKIADMMGKTSDELTDQLLKQQYLGMSYEQVVAMSGEEVANRVEALNAQDKFNAAMEKLQDLVGSLVGGPLGDLVIAMANLANNSTILYSTLGLISAISLAKLVTGVVSLATALTESAVAAATTEAFINPLQVLGGLAIAAAAAGTIMALIANSKKDPTSVGDMYSAKGKTLISTKEGGLFEPSPNDEIAVAPGIGDMINRPQKQTAVVQDNSALLNELKDLNKNTMITNQLVQQTNNKSGTIIMSGDRVGTALVKGNYNLA
jgi:hypothetical protein